MLTNLSSGMPSEYNLIYAVKNTTMTQNIYVEAYVRTAKGILNCHEKYRDGDPWGLGYLTFGELGMLSVKKAEKTILLIGCSCARTKTKTNPKTNFFVRSG